MGRRAYPSDLTEKQWELLVPLIPDPSFEGRQPFIERREIVNGILYVLRSGCPWRLLPHEFPAWQTVYWYFQRWQREGVWEQIFHRLRRQTREAGGRDPEPSAAVIESQSIKMSTVRGPEKGYGGGKKSGDANSICSLTRKAFFVIERDWASPCVRPIPFHSGG